MKQNEIYAVAIVDVNTMQSESKMLFGSWIDARNFADSLNKENLGEGRAVRLLAE